MVKKYGLYSIILMILILGRIFIIPLFVPEEDSTYMRILRNQVLRDYPYYEIIVGKDMKTAISLSEYEPETIVALDVLLKNNFDLERANEEASVRSLEFTGKMDEEFIKSTKVEIREIYNFYHIKGVFTEVLLNIVVILMLSISILIMVLNLKDKIKARNKTTISKVN